MSSIPEEIYLQILLRLPVKSTFVCKCVCKNWLDLISSPEFKKMHLDFNFQNKNYNLMLTGVGETSKFFQFHSISYASLSSVAWMNEFQDGGVEMAYPFQSEGYVVSLRSFCNGLVCLLLFHGLTAFLCLWNPATKEYKELPEAPRQHENLGNTWYNFKIQFCAIYTLGYDYKIDDYKLVKLVNLNVYIGEPSCVYVYTLGSNSWKYIQTIPYDYKFTFGVPGDIVSGTVHWLVKTLANSKAIVSFDIIDETFEELQLPEELLRKKELFTSVGEWEECLCLLVNADNFQFDVWVLQEYRVQDSWSKHFSITLSSVANDSFFRLMWSFDNGKILLTSTSGDFVLYDLKNESPRETRIHRRYMKQVNDMDNYVESLVALNSGTYVGR